MLKYCRKQIEACMQGVLILILGVLMCFTMKEVQLLQGTARVVNYAGIVRGATQRLVKLEMSGKENEELSTKLDGILYELKNGGDSYKLIVLDDERYQEYLEELMVSWGELKEEINKVRKDGYQSTQIVEMSEEYFHLADKTVSAAESYSENIVRTLTFAENLMIFVIIILFGMVLYFYGRSTKLSKRNTELESTAYLDKHTGLPNKSRCEELLHMGGFIKDTTCCIMVDMNNLKKVNDTLGHAAGDEMISNFARLLRFAIPKQHFVGRYGGDEFIAILHNITEAEIKKILNDLQEEVIQFNIKNHGTENTISYAVGYAISTDSEEITIKTLLERADYQMYCNKREIKEKYGISR